LNCSDIAPLVTLQKFRTHPQFNGGVLEKIAKVKLLNCSRLRLLIFIGPSHTFWMKQIYSLRSPQRLGQHVAREGILCGPQCFLVIFK